MFKKLLLLFSLFIFSSVAHSAPDEKYVVDRMNGSTAVVTPKKRPVFTVPASVPKTAKALGKGVGTNLIALAVYDLLGKAVDWVLDPANNAVVYDAPDGYMWRSVVYDGGGKLYATPDAAAQGNCNAYDGCTGVVRIKRLSETSYQVFVSTKHYPENSAWTVDRVKVFEKQSIPLEVIASQIHSMADNGNTEAQRFLEDIANQRLAEGEFDDNGTDSPDPEENPDGNSGGGNTQTTPTKPGGGGGSISNPDKQKPDEKPDPEEKPNEPEEKPDPEEKPAKPDESPDPEEKPNNPNTPTPSPAGGGGGGVKLEFPKFCDWAKHVCDFIDWFKEPPEIPEPDPYKPEITDLSDMANQDINKAYYNADGQCPAPVLVETMVGSFYIRYDPYCKLLSQLAPLIVAIAYIFGAYIIAKGGK